MSNDRGRGLDGFALVAVMGILLLVSAVLLPFSLSARLRALTAGNALRTYEDQELAASLASYVAGKLASAPGQEMVRAFQGNTPCSWGENALELKVQDHAGLIDLNAAGIDLLALGFQALRFSAEDAKALAFGVAQYRRLDQTSVSGLGQAQLAPEGLKHAAFEDIVELHDFLALRATSPARLAGTFTIHTQSGTLASDLASSEVQQEISTAAGRAMPFLVEARQARRAMTIVVAILRDYQLDYGYAGIFRASASGPVFDSRIPGLEGVEAIAELPGRSLSCPDILGPELAKAIGEMIE